MFCAIFMEATSIIGLMYLTPVPTCYALERPSQHKLAHIVLKYTKLGESVLDKRNNLGQQPPSHSRKLKAQGHKEEPGLLDPGPLP